MKIGGLRKFSVIDYPGKLAAVVFTQGCNFRCPFCFNPELVLPQRYHAHISEEDVLSFLKTRERQLEAVVVTGGEPTVQDDLPVFLKKLRMLQYLIKLDTNGSNPLMLQTLLNEHLLDYIAMDIKAPWHQYSSLTGVNVDVDKIKESMALILHSGIPYEFRTTAVRALLSEADIREISAFINNLGAQRYFIQAFIPQETILNPGLLGKAVYTQEDIARLQVCWGIEDARVLADAK